MGFQIKDWFIVFITASGKLIIPQITMEFQIKVKLVDDRTDKVRWIMAVYGL